MFVIPEHLQYRSESETWDYNPRTGRFRTVRVTVVTGKDRDSSITWSVADLLEAMAPAPRKRRPAKPLTGPLKLTPSESESDAKWRRTRRREFAADTEARLAEERARIAALRAAPVSEPAQDMGIYAIQPRAVASADRVPDLPPLPSPVLEFPDIPAALHEAMAPAPRCYGQTLDIFEQAGEPVQQAPRRSAIRR